MRSRIKPNGDVCDKTIDAGTDGSGDSWRKKDGRALLDAIAAPGILHDIALNQYPCCILELQVISHDKPKPIVIRISRHPHRRLVEIVVAYFNIRRGKNGSRPANSEPYIFCPSLDKVIFDLPCTFRSRIGMPATNCF